MPLRFFRSGIFFILELWRDFQRDLYYTQAVKTYEKGTLKKIHNIHVLNLFGSDLERATQHGHLLKDEIRKGAIPYLSNKLAFELQNDGPLKNHPLLQKIVLFYVNFFVFRKLNRNIPKEYVEIMKAILEPSGVDYQQGLNAASMPDAMSILSKAVGKHVFPNIEPQTFGCTSFVCFHEMSENGEVMQGRNLDFPVSHYWEQCPVVIYHHPDRGQRYCSITTAGVHVPGVTGFNESGLILAIHQLFSKRARANGVPIVLICAEIIRNAKSLEEAIDIAKSMKRAADCAVLVTDTKQKKSAVIETSHNDVFVRYAKEGLIAQSNYCASPRIKKDEIFFNWTTAEDNYYRHERLIRRCHELKGKLNEKEGIKLLGDHFDLLTHQTRGVGRTVSTIYNVQSAFFRHEKKKFWVSTGKAPSNLSSFLELSMDWDASQNISETEFSTLEPNGFSKTKAFQAVQYYTRAYDHFSNTKDFRHSIEELIKAVQIEPKAFAYQMALGFMYIKIHEFEMAESTLKNVLSEIEMTPHENALCSLFLGRALDLQGKRQKAKDIYTEYVNDQRLDDKIKAAFHGNFRKPYRLSDIDKTIFQFIFSDFLKY